MHLADPDFSAPVLYSNGARGPQAATAPLEQRLTMDEGT